MSMFHYDHPALLLIFKVVMRRGEKIRITLLKPRSRYHRTFAHSWSSCYCQFIIDCLCEVMYNHRFLEQLLSYKNLCDLWLKLAYTIYDYPFKNVYSTTVCQVVSHPCKDIQEAPSTTWAYCGSSVKYWFTFFPSLKNVLPLWNPALPHGLGPHHLTLRF